MNTNENLNPEDPISQEVTPASDSIYDDDGVVLESVVERIQSAVDADDSAAVREVLRDLHESEVGDILEAIDEEHLDKLVSNFLLINRTFDIRQAKHGTRRGCNNDTLCCFMITQRSQTNMIAACHK